MTGSGIAVAAPDKHSLTFASVFANNLQDVTQYTEESLQLLSDIENYFRKRSVLESKYAHDILKLCTSYKNVVRESKRKDLMGLTPEELEQTNSGSLEMTFYNILEEDSRVAMFHEEYALALTQVICDHLHLVGTQYDMSSKALINDALKYQKELEGSYTGLKKAKLQYEQAAKEVAEIQQQLSRAQNNYQTKEKELSKLGAKHRKLLETESELKAQCEDQDAFCKAQQDDFYTRLMPTFLDRFQELEEWRNSKLRDSFLESSNVTMNKVRRIGEASCVLADVIDGINIHTDMMEYLAQNAAKSTETDVSVMSLVDPDMAGRLYMNVKGGSAGTVGVARWKRYHFVLQDGKLYYFESEDARRAKGVIQIKDGNHKIRFVDASLFSKDYCFSINSPSDGCFYLACSNEDERTMWMDLLRQAARSDPADLLDQSERKVQSLSLRVIEAKDLPPGSYYCMVLMDSDMQARTQVKSNTSKPFWSENFMFDELPEDVGNLVLSVLSCKKDFTGSMRDFEIGRVSLSMAQLALQKKVDDWVKIEDPKSSNIIGSIRAEVSFTDETIRPLQEYLDLAHAVWERETLRCLEQVIPPKDRERTAKNLLNIYRTWGHGTDFLIDLCLLEIDSTENPTILFRGNSLATKALDQWMKLVAMNFLHSTLTTVITDIYNCKYSCEIDPTRVQNPNDLKPNFKRLLAFTEQAWHSILFAADRCPLELKLVFRQLQNRATTHFQTDTTSRYTVISGVFFLRFICPAILNPKLFNMVPSHPEDNTARTLTLVAKTIQNLANLVPFGKKEPFMTEMNEFIENNLKAAEHVINRLCTVSDTDTKEPPPLIDLPREMAYVHKTLENVEPEIRKYYNDRQSDGVGELLETLADLRKPATERRSNLHDGSILMGALNPLRERYRQKRQQYRMNKRPSEVYIGTHIPLPITGSPPPSPESQLKKEAAGLRTTVSGNSVALSSSPGSDATIQPPQGEGQGFTYTPTPLEAMPSPPALAQVLYNFQAQDSRELEVTMGDTVEILSSDVDGAPGWSEVRRGTHTGMVPSPYLQPLPQMENPDSMPEEAGEQPQLVFQSTVHLNMSLSAAEGMLGGMGVGAYTIICHFANDGSDIYTLVVRGQDRVYNHRILQDVDDSRLRLSGSTETYATLEDLLRHYHATPLPDGGITLGTQH